MDGSILLRKESQKAAVSVRAAFKIKKMDWSREVKRVIIVGSGAGGAAAARELQGNFHVTVLEAGTEFKPLSLPLKPFEAIKKTGVLFDEREIRMLFPAMNVRKTDGGLIMVNGCGLGGTTTLSAGNAVRADQALKKIGIDLDPEFEELYRDIPVTRDHSDKWQAATSRLYQICEEMGLEPEPIPKLGDYSKCRSCGRCVLGCRFGVKWDSRHFLRAAVEQGAKVVTGCRVSKVVTEQGKVTGVLARRGWTTEFYPADLVVLAAGGLATPEILERSGFACKQRLFVDPVLCVAARREGSLQNRELSMPFVVQREHYILSPYFDYLSFFFHKRWNASASETMTMMIKLADTCSGTVSDGKISKRLTDLDRERLQDGVALCTEIMTRYGLKREELYLGTVNAGHPGGMLPLTEQSAADFHPAALPEQLWIADATLFPESLGNPPILTIMAMAKRVGKKITERYL